MPTRSIDVLGQTRQNAAWKVVVDNYVECYHCRHAHPDFASLICMDEYRLDTGRIWSRQLGVKSRPANTAYHFDPGGGYQGAIPASSIKSYRKRQFVLR